MSVSVLEPGAAEGREGLGCRLRNAFKTKGTVRMERKGSSFLFLCWLCERRSSLTLGQRRPWPAGATLGVRYTYGSHTAARRAQSGWVRPFSFSQVTDQMDMWFSK